MLEYVVERDIDASPSQVWEALTTTDQVRSWATGITRIDGTITDGQKIKVFAAVGGDRAFPVRVRLDSHARVMTWHGGMPLGLFRGCRTFTTETRGDGSRFTMRERFTGPLVSLISRSMPDLTDSFEQFASDLKRHVEAHAKHA